MTPQETRVKSNMPGIDWPAVVPTGSAAIAGFMLQLEHSQWWSPDRLADAQFEQVKHVVAQAYAQSPFLGKRYREAGIDPAGDIRAQWSDIPILTRSMVQEAGGELHCKSYPKHHGKVEKRSTSGSTGAPVTFYRTNLGAMFWLTFTLREHYWQRRDFAGKLAAIRPFSYDIPDEGVYAKDWGPSTRSLHETGPACLLSIFQDVDVQRKWLIEQNPDYMLSTPSNIRAVARCFMEQGGALPRLKQVRSMGECPPDDLRQWVRDAWGATLADMYSSEEVGYMALQCPEHTGDGDPAFHVQSENVLLEVLDDDGKPCGPGQIGRVVVTALHNFATPFIRYEIRDYAQVGEPCSCGRGLPVLTRVMGRQRNMLRLPDGTTHWPGFHAKLWTDIAPIRQLQLVQDALDHIEARMVIGRKLTDDEHTRFIAALQKRLGFPHAIDVKYVDDIPRSKSGKFEDFMSLIDQ